MTESLGASIIKRLILTAIRGYQLFISPLLSPACRFYPTCSNYAFQSVARYGVFKGAALAFKRILRCNPFHPGGFDPVP